MKRTISTFLILVAISFVSCEKENTQVDKEITSDELNFSVTYDQTFDNTVYPSLILALSNYSAQENESFELINYNLTVPEKDCELKVELDNSTINNQTTFQKFLNGDGTVKSFNPMISWNYDNLKSLTQPGNVDLSFTCYIDDEEIDNKSMRLSYRSINECVYGYIDKNGEYVDLSDMFAAYINEDHPKIDEFLEEVLNYKIVNSFDGYQGETESSVLDQVAAIWYTLQNRGVKYSSITNTSNPSESVFTQYVRLFEEVYNNNQANCVDGSVFIASILKKIDIKPFLVMEPGHMYLGFYTSADGSSFELLETTSVGQVDLDEIYEEGNYVYNLDKYLNYLSADTYNEYISGLCSIEKVKKEISGNSFLEALNVKINDWNNNLSKFNDPENYNYSTIDIEEARSFIQPIGRVSIQSLQ